MPHTDPSESAGYETRDVSPRGIVLLGAGLIAVTGLAMLLLGWLFNRLDARAKRADPPVSPLAKDVGPPPGPELEMDLNYHAFDEASRKTLDSYGWVDRTQNVVHIPVERAMRLLAERGLPEPSGPSPSNEPTP